MNIDAKAIPSLLSFVAARLLKGTCTAKATVTGINIHACLILGLDDYPAILTDANIEPYINEDMPLPTGGTFRFGRRVASLPHFIFSRIN